jgi:hypothetical protein
MIFTQQIVYRQCPPCLVSILFKKLGVPLGE